MYVLAQSHTNIFMIVLSPVSTHTYAKRKTQ